MPTASPASPSSPLTSSPPSSASSGGGATDDDVVLLDETGAAIGRAPRLGVHDADTPLHLAFSCYLRRGDEVLLTRRALGKRTWPGVWTNSCCGHPKPGERIEDAVVRRVRQELGVTVQPRLVLPGFRYRAVSAEGVVENEVCPVFVADGADDPRPDPAEVAEWAWVPWRLLPDLVAQAPVLVSPWMVLQVPQLAAVLA